MSADMIIAVCDAPVYKSHDFVPYPDVITDHQILITRATDKVLDDLATLICSREDGETDTLESGLDEDQLALFDEDHDDDEDIVARRREPALIVLKHLINVVFPADGNFGEGDAWLSSEVTWLWVAIGDQKRCQLITGGLSHGDHPTDAMAAVTVLGMLDLFEEPFLRAGEEPVAPEAGPAPEGAPEPERKMTTVELYALNDFLTEQLAARGWNAETDLDYDALNELTHTLAPIQVQVDDLIEKFMSEHDGTPASTPEK